MFGRCIRLPSLCNSVRQYSTAAESLLKLGKLNHVAIATPNLEKASQFYKSLGADVSNPMVSHWCDVSSFELNIITYSLKEITASTLYLLIWATLKLK